MDIVTRFLEYVQIDTQSDGASETCPSTEKQKNLGHLLVKELKELGLEDAHMDEHGYVYGSLPGKKEGPVIGLIAHMDTAPDYPGANVKPQVHENYQGQDIVLNQEQDIVMKVADFPALKKYQGKTLITTDGRTLLGADNKAGIAIIMETLRQIKERSLSIGTVKVGFTPDEEIGRGANLFNVEDFGADFAFTIDGGELGELNYENFNAATASLEIEGVNIHPGSAKDKMINSMSVGMELNSMLPAHQVPEHTTLREGFFHLIHMTGSVENTKMVYIIRDHDQEAFDQKKKVLAAAVDYLNTKYQRPALKLDIKDSYFNMARKFDEEKMKIITTTKEVMESLDIEPNITPIRGGTDGARLSYMGLVTPNLFTGGGNFHGKYEFLCVEDMKQSVDVILGVLKKFGA